MTNNRYPPAGRAVAGILRTVHRRLITPAAQHLERRATERALLQLDDRTLRDIGLTRGQIAGAVQRSEATEKAREHPPSWPITG